MPCETPGHVHIWPTTGVLSIYSCEVICDWCGAHMTTHAYNLRRHVQTCHMKKGHFPGLKLHKKWPGYLTKQERAVLKKAKRATVKLAGASARESPSQLLQQQPSLPVGIPAGDLVDLIIETPANGLAGFFDADVLAAAAKVPIFDLPAFDDNGIDPALNFPACDSSNGVEMPNTGPFALFDDAAPAVTSPAPEPDLSGVVVDDPAVKLSGNLDFAIGLAAACGVGPAEQAAAIMAVSQKVMKGYFVMQ